MKHQSLHFQILTSRSSLDTDAIRSGVAAVLSQVKDGEERPAAYAAKSLSKSQKKWPPSKIKILALNFGTDSFFLTWLTRSLQLI